jgi:hypothetical protein
VTSDTRCVSGAAARRIGLGLAVVLVVAALVAAGVLRVRYRMWPWQALPERVGVCGRDYLGPGDTASLNDVVTHGNSVVAHVFTFRGEREVWASRTEVTGDRCGTGIYVRTGSNTFRSYALSGGP